MKKLVKKTRGSASVYDDNSIEFTPQGQGEPVFESQCKVGQASLGRTAGNRQSYVARLKVDADCVDPAEAMHDQLDKLAAKTWPVTAKPPKPRGKKLLDEEGILAAASAKTGILDINIKIDLTKEVDPTKKVINHLTNLVQCLSINETFLRQLRQSLLNSSSK